MKLAWLLTALILTGCGNVNIDEKNEDLIGYKLSYEISDKEGEVMYQVNGYEYSFLKRLTGRSQNAKFDSYYVVLTSDDNLTFEDVDRRFWSSYLASASDFVIVEYGLISE